jgi:replication-associated recombination protein RarA
MSQQIHKPNYEQKLPKFDKSALWFNNNSTFIPNNSIFREPQNETLSIKERAYLLFKDIIGLDQIKIKVYRALLQDDRNIAILLIGAAATGKTELFKIVEDSCNNVIFYDAAAGSTGAGLFETLRRNKKAKVLVIDELAELKKNEIDMIRGLASNGRVSKTLKTDSIDFTMKGLKIFATTNNPTKLSVPIKSRFQIYHIEPYSDDEFVKILQFRLLKMNIVDPSLAQEDRIKMATELSYAMLKYRIRNIRKALQVCSLIHKDDTYHDIKEQIESYIELDGSDVNINYNEVY